MTNQSDRIRITIASLMVFIVAIFVVVSLSACTNNTEGNPTPYNDLRVCSMHPWITGEGESECSICGMALNKVVGYTAGSPMPKESDLYTSADNFRYIHLGPGDDPQTGNALIPITESRFYQPRDVTDENHPTHMGDSAAGSTSHTTTWTCGMHPEVLSDAPGTCPVCQMALTPMKSDSTQGNDTTGAIDSIAPPKGNMCGQACGSQCP